MFLHKTLCKLHYYVMTLSFKFCKDPSFCCGDILKIMLNMPARGINTFLVVHCSIMYISFKFHKDLIFCCGDIQKVERCFFFATTVWRMTPPLSKNLTGKFSTRGKVYRTLLGSFWKSYCTIGTSVRRSSGRRLGVIVRAVDCWQWRSGH